MYRFLMPFVLLLIFLDFKEILHDFDRANVNENRLLKL